MNVTRRQVLTVGPILLVVTCYALAGQSRSLSELSHIEGAIESSSIDDIQANKPLGLRCEVAATLLRQQLGTGWTVLVREPYIISGDLIETELDAYYLRTIIPTAQALAVSYFDSRPSQPTTILLCSSDERFRECNLRLDDQDRSRYSGLYVRRQRRVIVNIASGEGTLAHELTHALAHADFPEMPEWFDEGLSSLHEECEFSADGLHLIGLENWRQAAALEALDRGELRLLEDVTSQRFGSVDRAQTDYAYVRSFCLYLQASGVLESFYRLCKANSATDRTGLQSLCQATNFREPRMLDDAFRAWLISNHARDK